MNDKNLPYEAAPAREMADYIIHQLRGAGSLPEAKSIAYVEHLYRAALASPAAQAQPVAWMFPLGNGATGLSFEQSCSTDTPLYTRPAPEALAPDAEPENNERFDAACKDVRQWLGDEFNVWLTHGSVRTLVSRAQVASAHPVAPAEPIQPAHPADDVKRLATEINQKILRLSGAPSLAVHRLQCDVERLAALAAHPVAGEQAVTARDVWKQVAALCEASEELPDAPEANGPHAAGFARGRRFEAKGIRNAIGGWLLEAERAAPPAKAELVTDEQIDALAWEHGIYPEASAPEASNVLTFARAVLATARPSEAREPLSDERIDALQDEYDCYGDCDAPRIHDFARAIERHPGIPARVDSEGAR
jgi:hypothetical protein